MHDPWGGEGPEQGPEGWPVCRAEFPPSKNILKAKCPSHPGVALIPMMSSFHSRSHRVTSGSEEPSQVKLDTHSQAFIGHLSAMCKAKETIHPHSSPDTNLN